MIVIIVVKEIVFAQVNWPDIFRTGPRMMTRKKDGRQKNTLHITTIRRQRVTCK
jgi:hypothetical protein